MKKKYVINSIIIMTILFIGGLILLFSSTDMGQYTGQSEIQSRGGSMDTEQLNNIINSTTENVRTAGIIISLVGGFGVLLSGCGIYKEI